MANYNRELATIQEISKITPIEGADRIAVATVLGWNVVVKKEDFKEGDKVVFFEIDSFLPIDEKYEFLRESSYKNTKGLGEGFRIKTIRLRKVYSQGLVIPLDLFPEVKETEIGTDLTEVLKVQLYEPDTGEMTDGTRLSRYHPIINKTDETRAQTNPKLIEELKGKPYYIAEKIDGQSICLVREKNREGQFVNRLFTRNTEVLDTGKGDIWDFFNKQKYFDKLEEYTNETDKGIFIQGEYYGERIQGNRLKIKGKDFRFFNIGNPETGENYSFKDWEGILNTANLKERIRPVEILEVGDNFNYTLEELFEKTEGNYKGAGQREGIVIRPQEEIYLMVGGRLSFKVINNRYLLKNE